MVSDFDINAFRRRGWYEHARCSKQDVDPDWWSTPTAFARSLARHICLQHCPVLAECDAQVVKGGLGITEAGICYTQKGSLSSTERMLEQPDVSNVMCYLCDDYPHPGVVYLKRPMTDQRKEKRGRDRRTRQGAVSGVSRSAA